MEIFYLFGIIALYFLPAIIGEARKHNDKNAITALNLFFGWTLLGWFVCLIWSLTGNVKTAHA